MVEIIIDDVRDHRQQVRNISDIAGIMIHRVGINAKTGVVIGYDAPTICHAFLGHIPQWSRVAEVTGRQNAYTFYVGGGAGPDELDGQIWQALPLDEIGHHGLRFSRGYIGIGCIGDFRVNIPSARQWRAAIDLCSDLCLLLTIQAENVVGHGEIKQAHGGDKGPGHPEACPGDFFSMDGFRDEVASDMAWKSKQDAMWRLDQAGVELP